MAVPILTFKFIVDIGIANFVPIDFRRLFFHPHTSAFVDLAQ